MIDLDELTNIQSRRISTLFFDAENYIYQDIARRLSKTSRITDTAQLQLERLQDIRQLNENIHVKLADLIEQSEFEIAELMKQAAEVTLLADKRIFDKKGIPYRAFDYNPFVKRLTNAIIKQTNGEIRNLTQTTAVKMMGVKGKYVPIPKFYEQTLDRLTMEVATGATSYTEAIKRGIDEMINGKLIDGVRQGGGIRIVRYEGKDKRPVHRRIEPVVRMTVLTGMTQLAGKVSINNMIDLQAEHVQTSMHNGARTGEGFKGHVNWQGRVFHLSKEFFELYGNKEKLLESL